MVCKGRGLRVPALFVFVGRDLVVTARFACVRVFPETSFAVLCAFLTVLQGVRVLGYVGGV